MHPSPAFRMSREDALTFASQSGIGHLTTVVDGRLESAIIPFDVPVDPNAATVLGHISASNRQVSSIEDCADALLIVQGPVAYVSPGLYPSKSDTGRVVPTLNYVSVQLRGRLEPVREPEAFRELLSKLTSRFESTRDHPWSINDAPSDYIEAMMNGIRGFRLHIDEIQGVAKHSQNRPDDDRVSVRESFIVGTDDERRIAERMT